MAGEVLKTTREGDETTVYYRVPDFHNFGAQMSEIERQCLAAWNPPGEQELLDMAASSQKWLGEQLDKAAKINPQAAELAKKMLAAVQADDEDEEDDEPPADAAAQGAAEHEDDDENDDPHVLAIHLSDSLKWTKKTQKRVDDLLTAWPQLRPQILQRCSPSIARPTTCSGPIRTRTRRTSSSFPTRRSPKCSNSSSASATSTSRPTTKRSAWPATAPGTKSTPEFASSEKRSSTSGARTARSFERPAQCVSSSLCGSPALRFILRFRLQPSRLGQRLPQQVLDLPVDAAQLGVGPAAQGVKNFRINAQ